MSNINTCKWFLQRKSGQYSQKLIENEFAVLYNCAAVCFKDEAAAGMKQ